MTHVSEFAADVLPNFPDSVNSVKNILISKIKPDSSKVVRGRMLALKADRNNLIEFSKKAENLAAHLKRTLVLENIPLENANQMVVDDTIELCRANASSLLVKSGLIGYKFKNPKEVIAKYVVETRKDTEEKQILAFKSSNGRGNNSQNVKRNNFSRNFNNGRQYNQNQNFSGQNRRGNGNFQNRGNYRGNFRSRGNFRGRGNYQNNWYNGQNYGQQNRQQNNRVYYAENGMAPPSGAAQAQNVQLNQADRH